MMLLIVDGSFGTFQASRWWMWITCPHPNISSAAVTVTSKGSVVDDDGRLSEIDAKLDRLIAKHDAKGRSSTKVSSRAAWSGMKSPSRAESPSSETDGASRDRVL
ncbi:hypothetical protein ACWEPL_60900 [Nonomuraea sp. NPDC004186]